MAGLDEGQEVPIQEVHVPSVSEGAVSQKENADETEAVDTEYMQHFLIGLCIFKLELFIMQNYLLPICHHPYVILSLQGETNTKVIQACKREQIHW